MGITFDASSSHIIMDQAFLIPEDRSTASHWAADHMTNNPAYRWVVGKYVESDRPNQNNQMWTSEEMPGSASSILHAPMNILHKHHHVVGTFTGAEVIYPDGITADHGGNSPYIEAIGAFWKYYFPTELAVIEKAHDEGSLWFSMECLGESMSWTKPDGQTKAFAYDGPASASYDGWDEKGNIATIGNPHFIGGALIFPPAKPAWKEADVQTLSKLVDKHDEEAMHAYDMFKEDAPHLDPQTWEELMFLTIWDLERK